MSGIKRYGKFVTFLFFDGSNPKFFKDKFPYTFHMDGDVLYYYSAGYIPVPKNIYISVGSDGVLTMVDDLEDSYCEFIDASEFEKLAQRVESLESAIADLTSVVQSISEQNK